LPGLNDDLLNENNDQINDAQKFAEESLLHYRELAKGKLLTEEQLLNMLKKLHLDHKGEIAKINDDFNKTLEKIGKRTGIQMSKDEIERYHAVVERKLQDAEYELKVEAQLKAEQLKKEGATQDEINAAQLEFELKLQEIRQQNVDNIIEKYEKLKLASDTKFNAQKTNLKSAGGAFQDIKQTAGKVFGKQSKEDEGIGTRMGNAAKALLGAAGLLSKSGTFLSKATEMYQNQAKAKEEELKQLDDEYNKRIEQGADPNSPEMLALKEQRRAAKDAAISAKNQAAALNGVTKALDSLKGDYKKAFGEASTILNDYMGSIDARMQGSDKNFKDMSDMISSNLSVSPFVKTTKVLEKLKEATEKGISYNVEQRAFLAGLTDRIATTFDAFDSNLLRIIRLQQADSTASRLGMEASLTKLFNNMFQDTSYLSDVADSISGAIVDAQSQLDYKASAEFEYVIQKWLGALSSLGMSSDSLTQIATGLNYIATGDVTSLASNSSLQTMFAMAASNANLEYSELLLNGLDATTTNKLLESMVVYLKDIADNSDNQVVKAAYGDIFNMSHSDMRALSNLTTAEISSLAGNNMSYDQMQKEVNNQFNQLASRTSLATMMTNVYDNVMYSMASDMVNNPVTFAMTKMLDWMKETETDIAIPFINAMGFGLDLNATVGDLMQMGLGITQAFSLTTNILQGLSSGGGLNLNAWGATETTQRGAGLNLGTLGTLGGTSGSIGTFAVSSNSSDAKTSSISSATDDSEETKKITNKNSKPPEKTIEDLYKAIVGESAESFVLSKDMTLRKVFNPTYEALQVRMNGLDILDGTLPVFDAALKMEVTSQLESIKTLMATHNTIGVQQVKIVDGTVIKVEKETIAAAIKEVLFADEDKNFNDLIDKVEGGTLKIDSVNQSVMVKNATGDKLQVSNLVW